MGVYERMMTRFRRRDGILDREKEAKWGENEERGKVCCQRIFDSGQSFNFIVFDLVSNIAKIGFSGSHDG